MRTASRGSGAVRRITLLAMLICASLLLSYLETLIPLNLLFPLPGFRLGLANILIMIVFFAMSPTDAAVIALAKILISSILFGNPISLLFSVCGAFLSLSGMMAIKYLLWDKLSFFGISVLSAALHNTGQIAAAVLLFGWSVISYLPALLIASVIFGGICGGVICVVFPRASAILKKGNSHQ